MKALVAGMLGFAVLLALPTLVLPGWLSASWCCCTSSNQKVA
ncbi:MAG: hypothetical protein ACRD96_28560 [Bryobacteraceae bacterium]